MHSRQTNFYMLPEEFIEVQKFCEERNCVFILLPVKDKSKVFSDTLTGGYFRTIYLVHREFTKDIYLNWIDQQNYYLVDDRRSLVIEFVMGSIDKEKNKFERSRLYYIKAYWEDDVLVSKDLEFIKWAESIMRQFKKQFLKKGDSKVFMFTEKSLQYIDRHKPQLIQI